MIDKIFLLTFCWSTLLGYLWFDFFSAPRAGAQTRIETMFGWGWIFQSLRFRIPRSELIFHLHHWLYLWVLCIFLALISSINHPVQYFGFGFCYGGIFHGLRYEDALQFFYRKKNF